MFSPKIKDSSEGILLTVIRDRQSPLRARAASNMVGATAGYWRNLDVVTSASQTLIVSLKPEDPRKVVVGIKSIADRIALNVRS